MVDPTPADRAHGHPLPLKALPHQDRITVPAPVPLTSFIGRDQEIAAVTALLRRPDVRLLTLTGAGGIGKTRLALRIVETVSESYADGVGFVPLAPVRDPDLVLPTVAQALNVPERAGQSLAAGLQTSLADRHLLLVLDNQEHLLDAVALLIADLLATCPHLNVLGTTRIRLGLSGEQVVPLGALGPETARALFVERAKSAIPSFAPTDETITIIDAICDRLDRLPLAIELAAARVSVLPPPALLGRLDQRLDLLTGGPRDAPPRLRDMRDTIAWSHDLLSEPEQVFFRRLAVFVGGFTLDAAETVAGEGRNALTGVSNLVSASLVNTMQGVDGEPRFTMLETIREFALERLVASGEESSVRQRHAHYVVMGAESVWELPAGPMTGTGTRRLMPEIDNIRVALGWTLEHEPDSALQLVGALMDFWIGNVTLAEGRTWVERALQAATNAPSRFRARALLIGGWLAMDQDDLVEADACLTEALARAREEPDAKLLIMSQLISGHVALKRNELARARQQFEEVRTCTMTGEPLMLAMATASLGQVTMAMGDLAEAQALFEEALAIHQSGSGPKGIAFGYMYLGQVTLARGDHARSAVSFREAIKHFVDSGDPGSAVRPVEGLAGVVVTRQPDQAARLLGAAAAMREGDDWPRDQLEVPAYEQTVATARTALGEPAFTAALEDGKQLSWEEVLAEVEVLVDAITEDADASPEPDDTHGLTPRELEVLRLLAEGQSNRGIAETLSLSERTVENHVRHILDKLDLESRVAAATWAVRHDRA